MKIYRVSLKTVGGESAGYSYHTRKTEAEKAWREDKKNRDEYNPADKDDEINVQDFPLTKQGIIKALNIWGSHPDNG